MQLSAICAALTHDTNFEFLDLSHNNSTPGARHGDPAAATFGDRGGEIVARLLRRNRSLRFVVLEGNAIGPQGAKDIADALCAASDESQCSPLQLLNLANNPIGDEVSASNQCFFFSRNIG